MRGEGERNKELQRTFRVHEREGKGGLENDKRDLVKRKESTHVSVVTKGKREQRMAVEEKEARQAQYENEGMEEEIERQEKTEKSCLELNQGAEAAGRRDLPGKLLLSGLKNGIAGTNDGRCIMGRSAIR